MPSPRLADHIGRVVGGRYRLLAPVGTGASAHVFVAHDTRLDRRVAVKILHPALAGDASFLRRFEAEARAAAALSHPHIMAVHDWGEDVDGPFLVSEFLSGGSLRAMLDRGHRLSPSQALLIGLETARGLDYAHRRGLVHRDIKPANLLFDDEGRLRIADFGLARALAQAAWTEPSGVALGTARYASPEQAQGLPVDGKADVYSLAVVLVEAVTGRVPFAAETTVATLLGRLDRPLEVPDELGPLVPVLARAGRPDPEDRCDAMALGAGLQAVAADLPAPQPLPLVGAAALDEGLLAFDPHPTEVGAATVATPVVAHPESDDAEPLAEPSAESRRDRRRRRREEKAVARAGRRRRRWPKVALLLLVVMAVLSGGAFAYVQLSVPSHPVPRVVGTDVAQATAALEALSFLVEVREDFFDQTRPGQVMSQDPLEGTSLKEGRPVALVVSRGPPLVDIPDLTGLTDGEAAAKLQGAGLVVDDAKLVHEFSEDHPDHQVIDWAPRTGTLPKGSAVALTISKGPRPRVVPTVAGTTFDQARADLVGRGLEVARTNAYSDSVPEGRVISSNPAAGAQVARGSTVTLVVSRGQPVVPNLNGKTRDQAAAALTEAGLKLGAVYGPGGTVFLSSPAPGTRVQTGSLVNVYIG